jgi:DNA repair protein RadD
MPVTTDFSAWNAIQERARKEIWEAFRNVDCLVAAAPTGFGKTRLGANLIKDVEAKGHKWVWYTHRKTLTTQAIRSFQEQGLDFGVRASGLADMADITKPGQIAMLQSERAATKAGRRQLHDAKFVIVDEAHANKTGHSEEVIRSHLEAAAKVLLLSATPVGLGQLGEKLIDLAPLSEMRKIRALLPAECFSPSEFSLKDVKKITSGDYSPAAQAKAVMRQQVVGDIYKHYVILNPDQVPTIAFAPDVPSSLWLCDYFNDRGVKAAHIDGQDVYLGEHDLDGDRVIYQSDQKMRDYVFDEVRAGRIKVIWNRFVMREGIDIPELGHAIFACAFGTPETWVQAAGRVLRVDANNPTLTKVRIQDHGGNCHRAGLGSPNQDRLWTLSDTNKSLSGRAKQERKEGKDDAPVRCPGCFREIAKDRWMAAGHRCPVCGEKFRQESRMVFQTDGKLQKVSQKKKSPKRQTLQQAWSKVIYSVAWSSGARGTCRVANARFKQITGKYPEEAGVSPVFTKAQKDMQVAALIPRLRGQKRSP